MQTKFKFEPLPDEVDLARRGKVERLMKLCPRRAEEFWAKWSAAAFADAEADALFAELSAPKAMHDSDELAHKALRQSLEQVAQRDLARLRGMTKEEMIAHNAALTRNKQNIAPGRRDPCAAMLSDWADYGRIVNDMVTAAYDPIARFENEINGE